MSSHDVLDLLSQARVITVSENGVVPSGLSSQPCKFYVVPENVLAVFHPEVVNVVFSISCRIDRSKLVAEYAENTNCDATGLEGCLLNCLQLFDGLG